MLARLLLAFAVCLVASGSIRAEIVEARNISVVQGEEGLLVNADFSFDLSPRLEEALHHGVPLYFAVEFELVRPRWYWLDEKTASEKLVQRLVYHSLSRQYRLSQGPLYRNFASLSEALRTLGTVRNWTAVDRERLKSEESYVASVRFRLDTTQLPKPFQVSAITNRDWTLTSDWVRVALMTTGPGAR